MEREKNEGLKGKEPIKGGEEEAEVPFRDREGDPEPRGGKNFSKKGSSHLPPKHGRE